MTANLTPEQLRDLLDDLEINGLDAASNRWLEICEVVRAHADALEELAKAQSSLAASERKCERLKFHADAMYQEHKKIADEWNRVLDSRAISPAHSATAYRAEFREES